jgi:hypothetical protein
LADLVVELARNAPALLFLRRYQAALQVSLDPVDALVVLNLCAQRAVDGVELRRALPYPILEIFARLSHRFLGGV